MMKQSFLPILSNEPRILILGSLPGDLSIKENQYYAHPQNRFWKILFAIYNESFSENYEFRQQLILNNHLALWDVAHSAIRKGSMDVEMKDEKPNKIYELLTQYPTIEKVLFDGKKAEQLFFKNFEQKTHINYISLPSTSPANAQYSLDRLIEIWKNALI